MIRESSKQLYKSSANGSAAAQRLLGVHVQDRRFRIFAVLWAIATLFHMAHSSIFDRQLNLALLTVAAFVVVMRPSVGTFLILILLQVFDAAFRMPLTTNHWVFTAFANLTILQVLIFLMVRHRTFFVSESDLFRHVSPLIRIEVIILYCFAAFHKLNSDFLLASSSCANELLNAQHIESILPLTEGVLKVNRYLTIVLEFALPGLLFFRRTRNAGVLLGLFFHCVLSYSTYNAFYDFSALMFASYFFFIGPGFGQTVTRAYTTFTTKARSFFYIFTAKRLAVLTAGILCAAGLLYTVNLLLDTSRTVHLYFFWTVYSILFCAFFILYLISKPAMRGVEQRPTLQPAHWSLSFVPLVVVLNGASPYLGLKTENSYAMFSNLRTEGGVTNHLIVPVGSQIFDFQKYVVEITSSTDTLLQRMANERKAMVLFEFKNYVNANPPDSIVYSINGQPGIFLERDIRTHAALGKNPYVLRKLLKFRSFSPSGVQECSH